MGPLGTRSILKPAYVYVASSWANPLQVAVCAALKSAGIDHYDFKNPPHGEGGFHWSHVMPSYDPGRREAGTSEQLADMYEYLDALQTDVAEAGFHSDYDAMEKADTFVLVLPCGRSAHLELGWAWGANKRTAILLDGAMNDNKVTPELMYKGIDYLSDSLFDLLGWLGVED